MIFFFTTAQQMGCNLFFFLGNKENQKNNFNLTMFVSQRAHKRTILGKLRQKSF